MISLDQALRIFQDEVFFFLEGDFILEIDGDQLAVVDLVDLVLPDGDQ